MWCFEKQRNYKQRSAQTCRYLSEHHVEEVIADAIREVCRARILLVHLSVQGLDVDGCSIIPIGSMYGIFTYIYHKNQLNVGTYTIHGCYGIYVFFVYHTHFFCK